MIRPILEYVSMLNSGNYIDSQYISFLMIILSILMLNALGWPTLECCRNIKSLTINVLVNTMHDYIHIPSNYIFHINFHDYTVVITQGHDQ